ncbi:MAG: hypothetical protein OHK0053_05780 [Microscillaceae bacterium]
MKELEGLKSAWNALHQNQILPPDEIRAALRGKTQMALNRIKRSIRLESGLLLLATLGLGLFFFFYHDPIQHLFMGSILLIALLSGLYYGAKYRQLSNIGLDGHNLRESLQLLIRTLERYLKIYMYGNLWLTPIGALSGFYYGFTIHTPQNQLSRALDWEIMLIAGLTVLLLTGLLYPILKWYLRKLYGRYLDEMKACLAELESPETYATES